MWILTTTLLWVGWLWTRQFVDERNGFSPRVRRALTVAVYATLASLAAAVVIQAVSKWGAEGVFAACGVFFLWSFLAEELAGA